LTLGEIAHFVEMRIPNCRPFDGNIATMPMLRGGEMVGAVIFHNYDARARNVEVAIAADTPRWLSRERLELIFDVAFNQIGVRRITARVDTSNTRSRKLAEGLGFQLEGLLRKAAVDGGDVLIYGLLREECRFLGNEE